MVNVDLHSAIITKVSNALDTLVSGEKPGFQTLSEGLVVLLCAWRSSGREFQTMGPWFRYIPGIKGNLPFVTLPGRAQRMLGVRQWLADVGGPPSVAVWLT